MNRAKSIRIAVSGVGNCACSLLQGIEYYRHAKPEDIIGLMHYDLAGYKPGDIEVVAAFDIDQRKVGKDVSDAILAPPNCTYPIVEKIPKTGVKVQMGPIMDGLARHMKDYPPERAFVPSNQKPVDVVKALKDSGAEILVNYLPVGSEKAVRFYAQAAIDAGVAMVNCIPVFIASDPKWARKFARAGLPIVGDDVKAQLGATITHRVLTKLFEDRGVKLLRTYQMNVGGNTDFLNMLERDRLASKKISKTESVQSQMKEPLSWENVHIGPSDYVPFLNDNKVCFIRMEGRLFGDAPMNIELRLSVEDSPNSGGVSIDAIRCCKLALDRGVSGPLISPSSYLMKHPPEQFSDDEARQKVEDFIGGKAET